MYFYIKMQKKLLFLIDVFVYSVAMLRHTPILVDEILAMIPP